MKAIPARLALGLALGACILLLIGGPGYRLGLWGLGFGLLGAMRYALFLGAAGAVLALVSLLVRRLRSERVVMLVVACALGTGAALVPLVIRSTADSLPPIHDITTDTGNPPAFVDILPLRADAPNPPGYAGDEVARPQREAYPEITPYTTGAAPSVLFDQALAVARAQGWEIVAADADAGRIEAVATTFWYGFKDDVVIRIAADGDGSRLDIRSKSRVGRSDLGANAARIRTFLDALDAAEGPSESASS